MHEGDYRSLSTVSVMFIICYIRRGSSFFFIQTLSISLILLSAIFRADIKMVNITAEMFKSRLSILQDFFQDNISLKTAVDTLASTSLLDATSTEGAVGRLWGLIIACAREMPEHQDKLVSILVNLSKLPDARTESDEPLTLHDMQVWKDLPTLGWHFRNEWNGPSVPGPDSPPESRQKAISDFINVNRFTALLMATEEPVFNYSWFALVTLREALETPPKELPPTAPLDTCIPAAAVWIEVLGVEIYEWDEEFEHGPLVGAPGRGGPLWNGKHGFCEDRWALWRERFGELARMEDVSGLGEQTRTTAREAELMMRQIENGDVL